MNVQFRLSWVMGLHSFLLWLLVGGISACKTAAQSSASIGKDMVTDTTYPAFECPSGVKRVFTLVPPVGILHRSQLPPISTPGVENYGVKTPLAENTYSFDVCVEGTGPQAVAKVGRIRLTGGQEKTWITPPTSGGVNQGLEKLFLQQDVSQVRMDWPLQHLVYRSNGSQVFAIDLTSRLKMVPLGSKLVQIYQADNPGGAGEVANSEVMVGGFVEGEAEAVFPLWEYPAPPPAWSCPSGTNPISVSLFPPEDPIAQNDPNAAVYYSFDPGNLLRFDLCLATDDAIQSGRLVQRSFIPDILSGHDRLRYGVIDLKSAISRKGLTEALFGELDRLNVIIPIPGLVLNKPNVIQMGFKEVEGKRYTTVARGVLNADQSVDLEETFNVGVGDFRLGDVIALADGACPQGGIYNAVKVRIGTFSLVGDSCAFPAQFETAYGFPKLEFRDTNSALPVAQRGPIEWKGAALTLEIFKYNVSHHNTHDSWVLKVPGAQYEMGQHPTEPKIVFKTRYGNSAPVERVFEAGTMCGITRCVAP